MKAKKKKNKFFRKMILRIRTSLTKWQRIFRLTSKIVSFRNRACTGFSFMCKQLKRPYSSSILVVWRKLTCWALSYYFIIIGLIHTPFFLPIKIECFLFARKKNLFDNKKKKYSSASVVICHSRSILSISYSKTTRLNFPCFLWMLSPFRYRGKRYFGFVDSCDTFIV